MQPGQSETGGGEKDAVRITSSMGISARHSPARHSGIDIPRFGRLNSPQHRVTSPICEKRNELKAETEGRVAGGPSTASSQGLQGH